MLDEHGMPVPSDESPLPWAQNGVGGIDSLYYRRVCDFEAFSDSKNRDFTIHAANWIIPCREIVRRLADGGTIGDKALMYQLWEDAARLWAKMQRDALGGDGETSL